MAKSFCQRTALAYLDSSNNVDAYNQGELITSQCSDFDNIDQWNHMCQLPSGNVTLYNLCLSQPEDEGTIDAPRNIMNQIRTKEFDSWSLNSIYPPSQQHLKSFFEQDPKVRTFIEIKGNRVAYQRAPFYVFYIDLLISPLSFQAFSVTASRDSQLRQFAMASDGTLFWFDYQNAKTRVMQILPDQNVSTEVFSSLTGHNLQSIAVSANGERFAGWVIKDGAWHLWEYRALTGYTYEVSLPWGTGSTDLLLTGNEKHELSMNDEGTQYFGIVKFDQGANTIGFIARFGGYSEQTTSIDPETVVIAAPSQNWISEDDFVVSFAGYTAYVYTTTFNGIDFDMSVHTLNGANFDDTKDSFRGIEPDGNGGFVSFFGQYFALGDVSTVNNLAKFDAGSGVWDKLSGSYIPFDLRTEFSNGWISPGRNGIIVYGFADTVLAVRYTWPWIIQSMKDNTNFEARLCDNGMVLLYDGLRKVIHVETNDGTVDIDTVLDRKLYKSFYVGNQNVISPNGRYWMKINWNTTESNLYQNPMNSPFFETNCLLGPPTRPNECASAMKVEYCDNITISADTWADERCLCFNNEIILGKLFDLDSLKRDRQLYDQLFAVAPCLSSTCTSYYSDQSFTGYLMSGGAVDCTNDITICTNIIRVKDDAEIDGNVTSTNNCNGSSGGQGSSCSGCPIGMRCSEKTGFCEPVCVDSSTCKTGTSCDTVEGLCIDKSQIRSTGMTTGMIVGLTVAIVVFIALIATAVYIRKKQ